MPQNNLKTSKKRHKITLKDINKEDLYTYIPDWKHHEAIRLSQEILQNYFNARVVTFVPPGNVYSKATIQACAENGIKIINSKKDYMQTDVVRIVDEGHVLAFHDRDLVLKGVEWLDRNLSKFSGNYDFCFVKDL